MAKDRLAELQRRAARRGVVTAAAATEDQPAPAPDPDLDAVFQEVERMRAWTAEVEAGAAALRRLGADPTFHTSHKLQEEEEAAARGAQEAARRVCAALEALEAGGGAGGGGGGAGSARGRIVALQAGGARRRLQAALRAHHAALTALRRDRRLLLHAQIRLTNQTISEEECESLLDSKNISIFVDNVRSETAAARLALREAEARLGALRALEAQLADVGDLFRHLALLVAQQQDQIDSVEYYALQATEYVELGGRQLLKGTVSKARANKKKMGLILCLVTGVAVVLLVLILT